MLWGEKGRAESELGGGTEKCVGMKKKRIFKKIERKERNK